MIDNVFFEDYMEVWKTVLGTQSTYLFQNAIFLEKSFCNERQQWWGFDFCHHKNLLNKASYCFFDSFKELFDS